MLLTARHISSNFLKLVLEKIIYAIQAIKCFACQLNFKLHTYSKQYVAAGLVILH